ncbi:hypothetical protein ACQ4PT_039927 [Festuca glaucescens]
MDGSKGPSEGGAAEEAGDGFQGVLGEKNKLPTGQDGGSTASGSISGAGSSRMTYGAYDKSPGAKARVAFHDPTIPRPQDVYKIMVNNCNTPFDHVWLERSEDGTRPIHPLEKLNVEQFIDRNAPESEPVRPADVEDTPFTLVEDLKGLTVLVNKLKDVNEFAVDLEHNQYRSFQGLTCLMQISTRTEDFIIDTLKLRIYIGSYLTEHFKDPTKRKIMHGADRDIMWLQRDFRVYVCNLFDTGQASRVLQMERNSLEYLLRHFCGVTANKAYQNADWRSRPLSDEMIKYAREDTHFLLYIYDLMRLRLQQESTSERDLLLEVQKRSNEICSQLYEKEQLTDRSYLHIYGLQEHELDAKQLAVVYALYQWRDFVAREQDESTGYVLPNKALIEIGITDFFESCYAAKLYVLAWLTLLLNSKAKKMPTTTEDLQRIVKSKYPVVEVNFDLILDIVWNATGNSTAFEATAEQLKKVQLGQLDLNYILDTGEVIEMAPRGADNVRISLDSADQYSVGPSSTANIRVTSNSTDNVRISLDSADQYSVAPSSTANIRVTSNSTDSFTTDATLTGSMWLHDKMQTIPSSETKTSRTLSGLSRPFNKEAMSNNKQETFGALVGNSISGMQTDYFGGYSNEQAKSDVENIQPSAYYYPQFPDYSSSVGWNPQDLEGIETSGYHAGCYYGYQPSINQSSTGTGQPAARNNEGGFQDRRKQQSSPHPGQLK